VEDEVGQPLAGVRIRVVADGISEDALTGLARPSEPGYADVALPGGKSYCLVLLDEQLHRASDDIGISTREGDCGSGQHVVWQIRLSRTKRY
jgi:hypothetical protein